MTREREEGMSSHESDKWTKPAATQSTEEPSPFRRMLAGTMGSMERAEKAEAECRELRRDLDDARSGWESAADEARELDARAEQAERERDEARAEVERLRDEIAKLKFARHLGITSGLEENEG